MGVDGILPWRDSKVHAGDPALQATRERGLTYGFTPYYQ
jgi:hypothetical protein